MGANLIYFSPLHGSLPEADAYWIPGGYPELHLDIICENSEMRTGLVQAANAGKPILAECGGMMALGQKINGVRTFDLLAGSSEIQPKLQGLGTQHVTTEKGTIGAHTFHYGRFDTSMSPAYIGKSKYRTGEAVYIENRITASFLHFYFPSNPILAAQFFLT
jgi:cobyrinic acid a,c-diamide synthase